jgi:hypothetical protein
MREVGEQIATQEHAAYRHAREQVGLGHTLLGRDSADLRRLLIVAMGQPRSPRGGQSHRH